MCSLSFFYNLVRSRHFFGVLVVFVFTVSLIFLFFYLIIMNFLLFHMEKKEKEKANN